MNKQINAIIKIQEFHNISIKKRDQINKIPDEVKEIKFECEKEQSGILEYKKNIVDLKKKQRKKEQDVEDKKALLSKTKKKLTDVKTNKEYTSLLSEIENINSTITELEDSELELMELIEENEKKLPKVEEDFKSKAEKFTEMIRVKDAQLKNFTIELKEKESARDELKNELDEELLTLYHNLLKIKNGIAAVNLEKDICQGCFTEVPPQFGISVRKSEKIHICPQCARILFFKKNENINNNHSDK